MVFDASIAPSVIRAHSTMLLARDGIGTPALDLTLSPGAGPILHVAWAGGSAEI